MLIDKNKIVSFCLELTSYLCIIQKNIVLSTNMAACFMSRDRKKPLSNMLRLAILLATKLIVKVVH